ncbi:hypothetical protein Golob_000427 [Gossypium lobatum]|uniref:RNase H type-1 domain-containing protein n=1 Tax=Gossypium lobatum TaxID=34289 RepID=A0A7J8N886_9ROSI|nr:hypothetical protein [Gossypium lobatum]
MGLEIGLSVVEVEGDALSVINKSQSNGLDRSEIGAYIKDIQQLKRGFQRCWFKHTPRMENRVAHALATEGLKRGEHIYLRSEVPEYGVFLLENDRR